MGPGKEVEGAVRYPLRRAVAMTEDVTITITAMGTRKRALVDGVCKYGMEHVA